MKPSDVTKVLSILFTAFVVNCGATGGGDKYDGTYNYSLSDVHGISTSCFNCIFIVGGVISNSDASFYGATWDEFENITFYGPCPNGNSSTGTYTGLLGGANPYAWTGTWTCSDGTNGGTTSTWTIHQ
ncbi:MAG: hypothetical protein V1647_00475 [Pseudomonadota bacterium]